MRHNNVTYRKYVRKLSGMGNPTILGLPYLLVWIVAIIVYKPGPGLYYCWKNLWEFLFHGAV
jgi:hypothetical protein